MLQVYLVRGGREGGERERQREREMEKIIIWPNSVSSKGKLTPQGKGRININVQG
jgi:hypothetical protein